MNRLRVHLVANDLQRARQHAVKGLRLDERRVHGLRDLLKFLVRKLGDVRETQLDIVKADVGQFADVLDAGADTQLNHESTTFLRSAAECTAAPKIAYFFVPE